MQNNYTSNNPLLEIVISPIRMAKRLLQREPQQRIQKYDEETPATLRSTEFPVIVIAESDE